MGTGYPSQKNFKKTFYRADVLIGALFKAINYISKYSNKHSNLEIFFSFINFIPGVRAIPHKKTKTNKQTNKNKNKKKNPFYRANF